MMRVSAHRPINPFHAPGKSTKMAPQPQRAKQAEIAHGPGRTRKPSVVRGRSGSGVDVIA